MNKQKKTKTLVSEQETKVERSSKKDDTKIDVISIQERIQLLLSSGSENRQAVADEFNVLSKKALQYYTPKTQPINAEDKERDIENLRVFLKIVHKYDAPLAVKFNKHYEARKTKLKASLDPKPNDPAV